jgi:peptidoglycan pentaglycine glycine transferase (the second and third glycine)
MQFVELEPNEFRKFADKHPNKSFYQTPEIANLREQNGWTVYYFGVKTAEKLVAASLVVAKPAFLGKSIFYAPGGPLVDYEDTKVLNFFIRHLRHYIKTHNGYVLHIEPYYELIERNRAGEPVENGFNHQKALKNLQNLGFKPLKTSDEPKYAFVLELKNRTPDEIFADLKRNTRNHIRKAEKKGVRIRELSRAELPIFKQITKSTSARRNFADKSLKYYEQMYDLFAARGEVKFLVAEVPEATENDKFSGTVDHEAENGFSKGVRSAAARGKAPATRGARPLGRELPKANGLTGRAPRGAVLASNCAREHSEKGCRLAPTTNKLSISAAMFILYGDEVIYLFSGSDEKYMKEYNAQYLIQWHMIKYAAEHKFKRYNFYGINGLPDPNSKDYGIYDFKKGFASEETGRVTELLGAHELPTNSPFYELHALLHRLKHH